MMYYFAYGSNLHPVRLVERVPSARLVGTATYPSHRLVFHKRSHDGSSKCTMLSSGSESDQVYGAVYQLSPEHKAALDRYEGCGQGYLDTQVSLRQDGKTISCFTYLAQSSHLDEHLKPYHWYKELVIAGAQFFAFPESYISRIEIIESMDDPDQERRSENEQLLDRIMKYC